MDREHQALPALPPAAIEQLRQGNKIAAIKILREVSGLGLKNCRDAIDSYPAFQPDLAGKVEQDFKPFERLSEHQALPALPAAAIEQLRQGNKIAAIKILREASGLGLKDCKDKIDRYAALQPDIAGKVEQDLKPFDRLSLLVGLLCAGVILYFLVRLMADRF